MQVAAIQMRSGIDVGQNIAAASELIRAAAAAGATFIATPEMTHLLDGDAARLRAAVQPVYKDAGVRAFGALAAELGTYLLIGSLAILRDDGQIANRSCLFAPDGSLTAQYDKIHLFEAVISAQERYREADTYAAGKTAVTATLGEYKLGLSICYDLRFPALYAGYAKAGVDIICVPAAFTVATGQAHWETLLRARAIETGAYVIAPAQGGPHEDGRQTWGRTMIVSPWGEVVAKLDHDSPGILTHDIEKAAVTDARARIPAWSQMGAGI